MIVCSCAVVTDKDLETAVLEIMSQPNAPLPTPGVVYRHLEKKMNCCGCATLAADTIYAKMEELEAKGLICPCACATAKTKLQDIVQRPARRVLKPAARSVPTDLHSQETAVPQAARRVNF
jgi:GTP cyclohydrolase FolE2